MTAASSREAVSRRFRSGVTARAPVLVSIVAVLLLWQLLASTVPSYTFPKPLELLSVTATVVSGGTEFSLLTNYGYTLLRIFVATVVCLAAGIGAGIIMGLSDRAKGYLYVYALMTFAFPSIIWALLGVLWFGLTTILVPVFAVFMIVTPYVAIIIEEGMQDLDTDLVKMGNSFDANSDQLWKDVYIPHLQPHIFASTRLTFTLAWKITIVAEIFGTSNGVGQIVMFYFEQLSNDMILAWAVPMMIFMYGVEKLLRRFETQTFAWRDETADVTVA